MSADSPGEWEDYDSGLGDDLIAELRERIAQLEVQLQASPKPADRPDIVDVPLFAADFDLLDHALGRLSSDYNDVDHDVIAGLRDRLKRSRLLP